MIRSSIASHPDTIQCTIHFLRCVAIHIPWGLISLLLSQNTIIDIVPHALPIDFASKIKLLILRLIKVTWSLLLLSHEPLVRYMLWLNFLLLRTPTLCSFATQLPTCHGSCSGMTANLVQQLLLLSIMDLLGKIASTELSITSIEEHQLIAGVIQYV